MSLALRTCVIGTAAFLAGSSAQAQARQDPAGPPPSLPSRVASPPSPALSDHASQGSRSLDPRDRGRYRAFFLGASQVRIPNVVLSAFLRSYSNALCRKKPGAFARSMGVNRSDTCNFSLRAGLRRVRGVRGYDLELGYTRLAMPKSNWVAKNEEIPAADLLEFSLHAISVSAGIWRDVPLARRRTRWSWRFGAQLGMALVLGGIHRTKLGAQPSSCNFDTLGNLSLCRPYRPLEFNEPTRRTRAFAHCDAKQGCDPNDLERAGRSRVSSIPPLLPWLKFWTGPGYAIDRNTRIDARVSLGVGLGIGLGVERRLGR